MSSDQKTNQKSITKSAGIFGSVTMLSRVLGLVRDVLSAVLFGTSYTWDAFVIAYTIPNMFRTLLGEGALTGAFVPMFAKYLHEDGKERAWNFVNKALTALSILLIVIIMISWIVSGIILQFNLSIRMREIIILSVVLFPYMFFVCDVALFMGILNTFYHFFLPAFSPVIQNIVFIVVMLFLVNITFMSLWTKVLILSLGISVGGIVQFASHYMMCKKYGMKYKFEFDLKDEGVKKVWTLMLPAVLGLSIYQINLVVDRFLAFIIGEGAASSLYYSNRLIQLPIGLFGVALATTSFPLLSHHAAAKKYEDFKNVLSRVMQMMVFITLPASLGLMILSYPIIRMIYEHNQFGRESTIATSYALAFYSIGLIAYCCSKVIIRAYYSLQDTKTPVKIGIITLIINVILNLILMFPLKQGGLALATSLTAFLGLFMMIRGLNKKVGAFFNPAFYRSLKISSIATFAMSVIAYLSYIYLNNMFSSGKISNIITGFVPVTIGAVVYILVAFLFKSDELSELLAIIKNKVK